MRLCEQLQIALEGECVYYGVPKLVRRQGQALGARRRLFKLNGLWFEVKTEDVERTVMQAGWGNTPPSTRVVDSEQITSVDLVMSHDVGEVKLPRPAIVIPGFTTKGNITFDDAVVTAHRHLVFGNVAPVGHDCIWKSEALSDEKPWVETVTGNHLAVVEYVSRVNSRKIAIEDQFAERVLDIRERERVAMQAAREVQDKQDAAENPAWGSW